MNALNEVMYSAGINGKHKCQQIASKTMIDELIEILLKKVVY